MLARIAALLRRPTTARSRRVPQAPHNGWPRRHPSTWRWRSRGQPFRTAGPDTAHWSPAGRRAPRLRTYVRLFVLIAAANDVRCDDSISPTFVYAPTGSPRTSRHQPRPIRQPGGPDGRASDALHLASGAPGPRRRSPPDSSSWRSAPSQRLADARADSAGSRRTVIVRLVPQLPLRTRTSKLHSTTVVSRGAWRSQPGHRGVVGGTAPVISSGTAESDSGTTSCPGHGRAGPVMARTFRGIPNVPGVRGRRQRSSGPCSTASPHGSPMVEFFGTQLTPKWVRFDSVASVQRVDALTRTGGRAGQPTVSPVRVPGRTRRPPRRTMKTMAAQAHCGTPARRLGDAVGRATRSGASFVPGATATGPGFVAAIVHPDRRW